MLRLALGCQPRNSLLQAVPLAMPLASAAPRHTPTAPLPLGQPRPQPTPHQRQQRSSPLAPAAASPSPAPPPPPSAPRQAPSLVRRCFTALVAPVQEAAWQLASGGTGGAGAWAQEPRVLDGIHSPYYQPGAAAPPPQRQPEARASNDSATPARSEQIQGPPPGRSAGSAPAAPGAAGTATEELNVSARQPFQTRDSDLKSGEAQGKERPRTGQALSSAAGALGAVTSPGGEHPHSPQLQQLPDVISKLEALLKEESLGADRATAHDQAQGAARPAATEQQQQQQKREVQQPQQGEKQQQAGGPFPGSDAGMLGGQQEEQQGQQQQETDVSYPSLHPAMQRRAVWLRLRGYGLLALAVCSGCALAAPACWLVGAWAWGTMSPAVGAGRAAALLLLPLVVAEASFIMLWRSRHRQLEASCISANGCVGGAALPSLSSSKAAFERFMQDDVCDGLDLRSYLSAWFRGTPFEQLKRDNVSELLAYAFYYRSRGDMELCGLQGQLELMVRRIEQRFGTAFPPGREPGLEFMGHLQEPLRINYRPLPFYLTMELLTYIGRLWMAALGFSSGSVALDIATQHTTCQRPTAQPTPADAAGPSPACVGGGQLGGQAQQTVAFHWVGLGGHTQANGSLSSGSSSSSSCSSSGERCGGSSPGGAAGGSGGDSAVPIVFLHGVGCGLLMYVELITLLVATGHPVIVVEQPHVSMRYSCGAVPSTDEVAACVAACMDRLQLPRACVVAHSYGSLVASRLLAMRRDLVHSMCLIDPVAMGMFMPHLLRSFIYRHPTALREYVIHIVSRDLSAAAFFCRRFFWTDINLWPEDLLPGRTLLVLHGRDRLMDVPAVLRWLRRLPGDAVRVMYHARHEHGGFLLHPAWQNSIIAGVCSMLQQGRD